MAAKKRGVARSVIGLVRREDAVAESVDSGAVDEATLDNERAIRGADLIIIATPLGAMEKMADRIKPFLNKNAIVSDVGSTKAEIVKKLETILSGCARFVGGHPVAGSEKRGVTYASAELFENHACILTARNDTDPEALSLLEKFWQALGARVYKLDVVEHDSIMASVSHLPHVVAATMINCLSRRPGGIEKVLPYVGDGLKDSTRIAASTPDIWVDICISNRDELLKALGAYESELGNLKKLLKKGDANSLRGILLQAIRLRNRLS